MPIGFHPTSATDLDKAAAVQGNTVDGAESILESGFRSGRESRWGNGSDTIYQLVLEFDNAADASAYFDLSKGPKETGAVEGLPKSKAFEGRDESKGSHWVSVLIAQGPFIAVTQYSSHGSVDPIDASRQLALREAELLHR